MTKRMSSISWDVDFPLSKFIMDRKIRSCTDRAGWQHAVKLIKGKKIDLNKLKIAELGCGTGTTALTFALLGASITLIDFNRNVLKKTEDIYKLYNCRAELIEADCMKPVMNALSGAFDIVISSGLAEHFIGKDRERCIRYHKLLLKKGGFAYIEVPNKLSPFYQLLRFFRKLTGTWELEVEVPFSTIELKYLAKKVGFSKAYNIGNSSLTKDFIDYSWGLGSAVKQLFPANIRKRLHVQKGRKDTKEAVTEDMRQYCNNIVASIGKEGFKVIPNFLSNTFSAGLILFAFY